MKYIKFIPVILLLTVTSAFALPTAPSKVAVIGVGVHSSEVDLVWQDNSTQELGFEVWRSTDNVNFSMIASLPANTTAYSDTSVATGTVYYYQIVAFNNSGGSGSVPIGFTTPPCTCP